MKRYDLEFEGLLVPIAQQVWPQQRFVAELESFVDLVAAGLERLEAQDIDISTNLQTGHVRVAISVEADDLASAQKVGSETLLAALRSAGIATPTGLGMDVQRASTVCESDLAIA